MKKVLLIVSIVFVVIVGSCTAILLLPSSEPEIESVPTIPIPDSQVEPAKQLEFELLKEWQGSGIKTTESFNIVYQPWVISWANNPEIMGGQSMGVLQIMIYDVDTPNIPISLTANTGEKTTDTSYIYETGTFYLFINAANTHWNVQVFAYK